MRWNAAAAMEHGAGPGRASGAADGMAAPLVRDDVGGDDTRFRGVADQAPTVLWVTDATGACTYLNGAWYAYTGQTEAQAMGSGWLDAVHPEDLAEAKRAFATANAARKPFRAEFRLRRADGAYRWALNLARPRFNPAEGGAYLGFVGSVIDIHVRREAEERLRQSEARLKALFATVPVGLVISEAPSGRIVAGNPQIERILGHPLIHSPDVESYREWTAFHADGRRVEGSEYPLARAIATGEPAEGEYQYLRGDGTARLDSGDRRAHPRRPRPGRSPAASSRCSTSTRRSAPSRSSAGRTVAGSSARGSATGSGATRATCCWCWGSMAASGRSILPGRRRSATGRRSWSATASTASSSRTTPNRATPRWSGPPGPALPHFENRCRHRDGSVRWLSWTAAREGDSLYCVARDITADKAREAELEAAQEQLRQAQKMEAVGQLTGGIAHDFNNLLQVVIGNLEILQRNLPEDAARLRRSAVNAMSGARRAAALTARLLAFSRRQPLAPQPVDVNGLVAGMSELLNRTLGATVRIETALAERLWRAETDPNQLESAILNLAVNARDAMPAGGRFFIETANVRLDRAYAARNADAKPGPLRGHHRHRHAATAWTSRRWRGCSSRSSPPRRSARAPALA